MPTIDELYYDEYLDMLEEAATLPVVEPPYVNTRRGPGFGKRGLRKPQPQKGA
jgi:hypothetical protein